MHQLLTLILYICSREHPNLIPKPVPSKDHKPGATVDGGPRKPTTPFKVHLSLCNFCVKVSEFLRVMTAGTSVWLVTANDLMSWLLWLKEQRIYLCVCVCVYTRKLTDYLLYLEVTFFQ
jgi:hypothetical protein